MGERKKGFWRVFSLPYWVNEARSNITRTIIIAASRKICIFYERISWAWLPNYLFIYLFAFLRLDFLCLLRRMLIASEYNCFSFLFFFSWIAWKMSHEPGIPITFESWHGLCQSFGSFKSIFITLIDLFLFSPKKKLKLH